MSQEIENTEKCGVIGAIGGRVSLADFKKGFMALQHRGADAAGMVAKQDKQLSVLHKNGEISDLFLEHSAHTHAQALLGHNRYATSAGVSLSNAQPFLLTSERFQLALAHNGNLPDECVESLRLLLQGKYPTGASDSYLMTSTLLLERLKYQNWEETLLKTLPLFQGAFSLIGITDEGSMFGIRDPWGIRPLCLGKKDQTWVLVSESVALDAMGAEYFRELLPGEMITISADGKLGSIMYAVTSQPEQRCALESIYFAKNQSYDGKTKMFERRRELGRMAGRRFQQKHIPIDVVIPILNSGKEMSLGVSDALNMANTAAIKVRGKKRSFIQSDDSQRQNAVHQKHIVDGLQIKNQRILLCDDSLVRGTSLKGLIDKIKELKDQQPAEIHLVLGSEPVVNICDLGIDLPDKAQLLAARIGGKTVSELEKRVAKELGIKSVTYLDRQSVEAAFGLSGNEMCWHCFGGPHPINHRRRPLYRSENVPAFAKQKVVFLASGSGTHVYNFLRLMSQGVIIAKPLDVITNVETAGVIQRAATFNVPTTVISSKGKLKDPNDRQEYEQQLLNHILSYPFGPPDVIVLAGWMMVLSDTFLEPLAAKGITIINLHPALLSGTGQDHVMSSKGMVPELRGAHAVQETLALPLSLMPITGSTVHQVQPRTVFDTGKVLIKTEIARRETESEAELTDRIKAAEYVIFPLALQMVLMLLVDQPTRSHYKGVAMAGTHHQVAVLGSGGRESAFVGQLLSDPRVDAVHVFDWNASFNEDSRVIRAHIHVSDQSQLVEYCLQQRIDLVIVGPEQLAENGTSDALRAAKIPVFGASQKAIRIESDKAWARNFMSKLDVPQPQFQVHTNAALAKQAAKKNPLFRVVKASGLCGGKGVIVCDSYQETAVAIDSILAKHQFGTAGDTLLLEERLGWSDESAQEVSVMYYTDGKHLIPLPLVRDYKREFDHDLGKNTGSMGCHSAPESLSLAEADFVQTKIASPIIIELAANNQPFIGILYVSLMKTSDTRHNPFGLFVIEVNGRGGDPETIVQLAGQHHPHIAEFFLACATQELGSIDAPTFDGKQYLNVVLAAREYPDGQSKGERITGLEEAEATARVILHAGTRLQKGEVVTNGGRVLDVVGSGESLAEATRQAYAAVSSIRFNDLQPKFRTDIGDATAEIEVPRVTSSESLSTTGVSLSLFSQPSTRIEIYPKILDTRTVGYQDNISNIVPGLVLKAVAMADVYTIDSELAVENLAQIKNILSNEVIHHAVIAGTDAAFEPLVEKDGWVIEIGFLPGVTDNVGETAREMITDALGMVFTPQQRVYTSKLFFIAGTFSPAEIHQLAATLYNPLIQRLHLKTFQQYTSDNGMELVIPKVTLSTQPSLSFISLDVSDEELTTLGKAGILSSDGTRRGPLALDLAYLHAIRDYFQLLGRKPTDVELESIAQTWSEHCKHTIFADPIDDITDGLYKSYIQTATKKIRQLKGKSDICVSVFSDNSGAIVFDDDYLITDKVETHNSPSALDPFGGAITGVVGVNRDALGFGLGAKPILNRFGFCVADPADKTQLFRSPDSEQSLLSAERILNGIIAGVNSGGNCSGIPTPLGFVNFDKRFRGKPLVFVGTVGLIPRQRNGITLYEKQAQPGDYVVVIGGKVGIDGIHGATFSSEALSTGSPATAVQIGDPITQKKLSDALVKEARDLGLYSSITDNGAGGLSCSVAEMAKEAGGFEVNLDQVPLKYPGLEPWQIWISESQERMTLSVPPAKWLAFQELMQRRGVDATIIGNFTDTGKCIVTFQGSTVVNLDMEFLHYGLPPRAMTTNWVPPVLSEPESLTTADLSEVLKAMIGRLNIGSIEKISMQFDHEVQASSVLKPLQGKGRVNGDAAVIKPVPASTKGVVVSQGLYPSYSDLDPYAMSAASIDTAIRNAVVAGASLNHLAILDNFCWCSATEPMRLGQLKLATQALHDTAVAYETPIISGKDSMFNDFKGFDHTGQPIKVSIPPTLLVSSIGVIDDVSSVVSMDSKYADDLVYLLGETHDEVAGSEYYDWLLEEKNIEGTGAAVPKVHTALNTEMYRTYHEAVQAGLIASAISVSHGGLGVAIAKTALAGKLGMKLSLEKMIGSASTDDRWLFSESQGRILVTVSPQNQAAFEAQFEKLALSYLGKVTLRQELEITGRNQQQVLFLSLKDSHESYASRFGVKHTVKPYAAVLTGYGINCEEETAFAFEQAGAIPSIVHVNDFIDGHRNLADFQMLAIPGGFSFGDDTGSGNAMAQKLKNQLWEELLHFIQNDRLMIGICNGFQVLTNLGLLPAIDNNYGHREVALIHNDNATYTDRWVDLKISSTSPWLTGIDTLSLPIAHGEGKFFADAETLKRIQTHNLVAARYTSGEICRYQSLEANPNGSLDDIAAITDGSGRILGMMPHPERAISFTHLPQWPLLKETYRRQGKEIPVTGPGLHIFQNAVGYFN